MSEEFGYEPRVRPAGEVKAEVAALSSAVLDMVRVQGRITEAGPMELPWDEGDDPDAFHNVTHLWSLYGVDNSVLEQGMAFLADQLPARDWTVVKNGPDSSRNRNQEILAVHTPTRAQLEATWKQGLDGHEPLIAFSVYSRFFIPAAEPGR
ncbi:hypothetical protein [Streptomyces sp. NBC_01198]|uniref:hypothetical protein n=1 Tax=Streptomyces sp. NBC_01198 TaxID=2903769 RepID=UPI002E136D4C|nr:hypothetical protein OG702_20955 [Streptomyces sp. NBC_01198]